MSGSLSQKTQSIQNKFSSLSFASSTTSVKSLEFLHTQQELLRAQSKEWKNVDEGLVEAFSKLSIISKEVYDAEQKITQKHRFELASKEILLARNIRNFQSELEDHKEPDWPEVIMHLMSKVLLDDRMKKVHPEDRRDDITHRAWKKLVRDFYNCYCPDNRRKVWCAITQRYNSSSTQMKTAHIVPHHFGYANMGYAFGEPGNGMSLMWSCGNGLPMLGSLEILFDQGKWTLLGHHQSGGKPIEYTLEVLDDSILELDVDNSQKLSNFNHKRLVFKNNRRPEPKFVYWHYATSLMRHYKMQTPGIEEKIRTLVDRMAWGNTGPWYDRSTLKYMAEYWGDIATSVFKGTEKGSDEVAMDDTEHEEARLAAAGVYMEVISNDYPQGVEDYSDEEEL
jgi:hypothetical protein